MRSDVDVGLHKAGFSPVAACIHDQIRSAFVFVSLRPFLMRTTYRPHNIPPPSQQQRVCICRPPRRLCRRGLGRRASRWERLLFGSGSVRTEGKANGTGQCRVQIDQVRSNPVHAVLYYKRSSRDRFPPLAAQPIATSLRIRYARYVRSAEIDSGV